jgi:S-DNA-T family DNA segregation ATPase FtsK/SpoIIIE
MPGWCLRAARAIAPVRDVSAADDGLAAGGPLPGSVRLLEVLGLAAPRRGGGMTGLDWSVAVTPIPIAKAITQRWRNGGRSTLATVGVSPDGPFEIDLGRDGPHGLITGTAGSGKSGLLRSLVAALAVANRPDEMGFVLIDGTGGGAFGDCARLPHTLGMITRVTPKLADRALTSLSIELTRREHLLAQAGAKDVEDYHRRLDAGPLETVSSGMPPRNAYPHCIPPLAGYPPGTVSPGYPSRDTYPHCVAPLSAYRRDTAPQETLQRLVIVIDEFATLARELPGFVSGLVRMAERGRSLGVHLILATEQPLDAVPADIRAATDLRITLRVTGPGEFAGRPDAAWITGDTPGRGYVRRRPAALIPFQAGLIGGARPARGPAGDAGSEGAARRPVFVALAGWAQAGRPAPGPATLEPATMRPDGDADLALLVAEIWRAAAGLSIPERLPSPWVPPWLSAA